MVERYAWRGQCAGKFKHPTRRDARRARQGTHDRTPTGERRPGRLRIYRCPWCGYYHLGHSFRPEADPDATTQDPAEVDVDAAPDWADQEDDTDDFRFCAPRRDAENRKSRNYAPADDAEADDA